MKAFTGKHTCENCGETFDARLLHDIEDLEKRISPGEIVPSGQCPDCGTVCHIAKDKEAIDAMHVAIRDMDFAEQEDNFTI